MRKRGLYVLVALTLMIFVSAQSTQATEPIGLEEVQRAIREKGAGWQASDIYGDQKPSIEEAREGLGYIPTKVTDPDMIYTPSVTRELPEYFNWDDLGFVTSIKNQSHPYPCGSCWAFGGVASMESLYLINYDMPGYDLDLSEQFLVSCSPGGCYGYTDFGTAKWLRNTGTVDEACFPYAAVELPCEDRCADWASRIKKIHDTKYLAMGEAYVKNALYEHGPLPTSMFVYEDFRYYYEGGVYQHTEGHMLGGHMLLLIGWSGTGDTGYWIVKNSWGTEWGMEGFGYIKMTDNGCGFPMNAQVYLLYEDTDGDGCFDEYDPNPTVPSVDADADGYGDDCDCDDADPEISPGHEEVCDNSIDDDCDGKVDEQCWGPQCGTLFSVKAGASLEGILLGTLMVVFAPALFYYIGRRKTR